MRRERKERKRSASFAQHLPASCGGDSGRAPGSLVPCRVPCPCPSSLSLVPSSSVPGIGPGFTKRGRGLCLAQDLGSQNPPGAHRASVSPQPRVALPPPSCRWPWWHHQGLGEEEEEEEEVAGGGQQGVGCATSSDTSCTRRTPSATT